MYSHFRESIRGSWSSYNWTHKFEKVFYFRSANYSRLPSQREIHKKVGKLYGPQSNMFLLEQMR